MTVNPVRLNHAVLFVSDLERSVTFYEKAFAMAVMAREPRANAAFLRLPRSGNHHDLGLFGVGAQPPPTPGLARAVPPGLAGRHRRRARAGPRPPCWRLDAYTGESSHGATKSIYGHDPDGNEFEVMWMLPASRLGRVRGRRTGRAPRPARRGGPLGWGAHGIRARAAGPAMSAPGGSSTMGPPVVRVGPVPDVFWDIPQQQQSLNAPVALQERLFGRISALPGVRGGASHISVPGREPSPSPRATGRMTRSSCPGRGSRAPAPRLRRLPAPGVAPCRGGGPRGSRLGRSTPVGGHAPVGRVRHAVRPARRGRARSGHRCRRCRARLCLRPRCRPRPCRPGA